MTREECHLWYDYLRNYPVKFTRQKVLGYYIADFYCPKARLVIEVDGVSHFPDEAQEYDRKRTFYLEHHRGVFSVLRFFNMEINTNFEAVCEAIDREVKRLLE